MDNEKKNSQQPLDEAWLDELLGIQEHKAELKADEQAVADMDLTKPEDLELERIVQETLAENWGAEPVAEPVSKEETGKTQMFKPVEEPVPVPEKKTQRSQRLSAERKPRVKQPEDPQPKKERPAHRKGYGFFGIPHLVSTAIWLLIVVAIGVSLGRTIWLCAADLLAFGREPEEVTITVTENDDIKSISKKLERAGLIRYAGLFELFADLTGKGEDIDVGTFTLNAIFDYNAMINAMVDYGKPQDIVEIMFPEGYNCAQMFALLEEKGVCTVKELEAYAANGELDDYWFLEGVSRGHKYCLEGYLAPDTYEFYTNDEPKRVLEKFLDEFDDRFTDLLKEDFIELNQYLSNKMRRNGYSSSYIQENQLTLHDVIILASIVEKETSSNRESYKIASVFYNRLTNQANFPYLQSDATVLYAIDYYNKGELITDAQINASPFNSYTNRGLIPGPICNPGLNSLGAALSPEDTGYFYFIYDKSAGEHIFSKTLAEHEAHGRRLEGQG